MTLVSDAKMSASRQQKAPTTKATIDQLVTTPTTTTGRPASTAMPNAPPRVPPMKAAVLKKRALTTLTSRTSPDDWRVKRERPPDGVAIRTQTLQSHSPDRAPRPSPRAYGLGRRHTSPGHRTAAS